MPSSPPRKVRGSHPSSNEPSHEQPDPSCPFCSIASTFAPISPLEPDDSPAFDPAKLFPPSFVVLSTPDVVAFLDIAPLTRGHVLVAPRRHRVKMGDLTSREGAEIGRLLPLLARSILRATLPDTPVSEADYNIVQNNGAGAAQVIPHVHFHIIPRPPLDTTPTVRKAQKSWTMFGRGRREELDEDDAELLAPLIRANVRDEVERERERVAREGREDGEMGGGDLLATVWGERGELEEKEEQEAEEKREVEEKEGEEEEHGDDTKMDGRKRRRGKL